MTPKAKTAVHEGSWRKVVLLVTCALLALLVVAVAPLTYPGYFQLHSGFLPVYNLYDLEAAGGGLGWSPLVGSDYDLWRGDGNLATFVAEAFRWLGAGGIGAVKWVFGLSLLLGGLGVFAFSPGAAVYLDRSRLWPTHFMNAVAARGRRAERRSKTPTAAASAGLRLDIPRASC